MNPVVQTIPATINPFTATPDGKKIVGVYSDEGISGTSTAHREGFKQMIADAMDGKIDLILTKSISRFARNTVDCLTTIRKLKEKGVEVRFEKENIKTLEASGELLITIMSSLAQEESRSISENTKWGRRKRMAEGKFNMPYKIFLGYDPGPDYKPVINEEQAETVRLIYQWYLDGLTCTQICRRLEGMGVKSPAGKDRWHTGTLYSILTNEKYKGSALLQKRYVPDFLTKKQKVNEGELPKYYIEDSHPAIVSKEMFEAVQAERQKRHGSKAMWRGKDAYACKVKCGCCGDWFAETTWHSNDRYRKVIFRCRNKYHKKTYCNTGWFTKEELQGFFLTALNERLRGKSELADNLMAINEELFAVKELEVKMKKYDDKYEAKRKVLEEAYDDALKNYKECKSELEKRQAKRLYFESVKATIDQLGDAVTEFDERLWCNLLDHIVVNDEERVTVIFRDGMEIAVPLGDLVKSRTRTASRKKTTS